MTTSRDPIEVLVLGASPASPPPELPTDDQGLRFTIADDAATLRAALPRAEVLFHWTSRTDALRVAWPLARQLRWVHVAGVGVDWALFPELVDSAIPVTNCRGVFDTTLPEYALALMLAMAKDIRGTLELQANHVWSHRPTEPLAGARILILGAGTLGRSLARLVSGLGMEVTLVARRGRPALGGIPQVYPVHELTAHLAGQSWLVLLAPLTDETRGIIGAPELALLAPGARVVNLSRGPLLDEAALIASLHAGHLAGAALDVVDTEPLPADHPLWDAPGVIVSPHIGGDVAGWERGFTRAFLANLARYRAGQPLENVIDTRLGYVNEAIEGGSP